MALSDKINLLVSRYVRRQSPRINPDMIATYLQDELRELETSIRSLTEASVQVAEKEPDGRRRGMVRYAISPWNPLGNGFTGLVVYNGSAWVAV